jgi:hypothetical protein
MMLLKVKRTIFWLYNVMRMSALYSLGVMVLNATFNNISVISVEETRVPGENHRPVGSH